MKKCPACGEMTEDQASQCLSCDHDMDDDTIDDFFTLIEKGDCAAIRKLIDDGAEITQRGNADWTPLHLAAQEGECEIAELLLREGADVDATDDDGWTPLHLAAQEGEVEMAKLLISYGTDITTQNKDNQTALDLAMEFSNRYSTLIAMLMDYEEGDEEDEEEVEQT
jgi:ankyrin repeat protein